MDVAEWWKCDGSDSGVWVGGGLVRRVLRELWGVAGDLVPVGLVGDLHMPGRCGRPGSDVRRAWLHHGAAFSHDGKRLVAAQTDGGVYVWDVDGSRAPIVLRGHPDGANSAAFSLESNDLVASGGADGTVRVWRLDKGAQSVAIPSAEGTIRAVAFTPNGSGLIAVGSRGARIWSCDFCGSTSDVLAVAQQRETRALTPDERALFLHDR
jgi:WD40 repeat protein